MFQFGEGKYLRLQQNMDGNSVGGLWKKKGEDTIENFFDVIVFSLGDIRYN